MERPTRCVDPILKYCAICPWGQVEYPSHVETYQDLQGSSFETHCILGYDTGRPEDNPTEEEIKEFEEWWSKQYSTN